MQETQGPKHASNLTHVISRHKVQPCHWPLLEYFAFIALHALRCCWWKSRLTPAVLYWKAPAASISLSRQDAAHSCPHVGPFYGASVYSYSLFIRRSTCGSYHIVSYRDILSDIVSYLSFSLMAVSCHHYFMLSCLYSAAKKQQHQCIIYCMCCWPLLHENSGEI